MTDCSCEEKCKDVEDKGTTLIVQGEYIRSLFIVPKVFPLVGTTCQSASVSVSSGFDIRQRLRVAVDEETSIASVGVGIPLSRDEYHPPDIAIPLAQVNPSDVQPSFSSSST